MESIGELVEKLVIANIKLWMVKDAQLALSYAQGADHTFWRGVAEQLERVEWGTSATDHPQQSLQKLLDALQQMQDSSHAKDLDRLKDLIRKDIALCETRAALRRDISERLGDRTPADTVKQYGK